MQIGENIRKYRKAKNMTQEEMAKRLGVTPPAVNKWENGVSYPDITLLAPVARLLDISLDTLLSFQGELTQEEMKNIIAEVDDKLKFGSYEESFKMAQKILQKYPNCDQLTWQLAMILDAHRMFREIPDAEVYDSFILECYTRALKSRKEEIRCSAAESLYNLYLRREQYEKAEEYLQYFSLSGPFRTAVYAGGMRPGAGRIQTPFPPLPQGRRGIRTESCAETGKRRPEVGEACL